LRFAARKTAFRRSPSSAFNTNRAPQAAIVGIARRRLGTQLDLTVGPICSLVEPVDRRSPVVTGGTDQAAMELSWMAALSSTRDRAHSSSASLARSLRAHHLLRNRRPLARMRLAAPSMWVSAQLVAGSQRARTTLCRMQTCHWRRFADCGRSNHGGNA